MPRLRHRLRTHYAFIAACALAYGAQIRSEPAAAGADAAPGAAAPAAAPAPMSAEQIIRVLNETIDWYRTLAVQEQAATEPSDWMILYENRQIALKVMALAFEVARADAYLIDRQPSAEEEEAVGAGGTVSTQTLAAIRSKVEAQGAKAQAELDAARAAAGAAGTAAPEVQAKIAELQSELDLIATKKEILASLTDVVRGAGAAGAHSLRAQIDAMAVALPASNAAGAPGAAAAGNARSSETFSSAPNPTASRSGLWGLGVNVFRVSEKRELLVAIGGRTTDLLATLTKVREPLVERLRSLSQQSDTMLAQAGDPAHAAPDATPGQFGELTAQLKEISAILVPLGKQINLLAQYRRNLSSWRTTVAEQTRHAVKELAIRFAALLAILGVLLGSSMLTRRAVFSYVQDTQRRHQLMLMIRIVTWMLMAAVVGFAFVGEFGSIATFAGLLTAGLALAMQSVLVSIVGYFFLIGKHGIRIGDRVQIGQVRGEVIELGLLRLYLTEFGADGSARPTGRVVAFANSVVFQATGGLFKQIPGVDFTWHEIILKIPPGADHAAIKEELHQAAVEAIEEYRGEIERQTREIQRTTAARHSAEAAPTVRLQFSASGVEAHVRYPVHLDHAAEIDERVAQALLRIIAAAGEAGGASAAEPRRRQ